LKKCWSVCEGDQTKFEPHAFCIYFGNILSYIVRGGAHKNANQIVELGGLDHMIWHHGPRYLKCFLTIYPDGGECKHKLSDKSWARLGICHYLIKKIGELFWPTSHAKWKTMHYLLLPIWIRRCMDFGHLPTHVLSTMPTHFNGDKEEMSIIKGPISSALIRTNQSLSGHATILGIWYV
jgi:hypothetical protein